MERNIRMKEIAKIAGVSTMTVSNVVHGRYNKVSQETKERVEAILKEMNYRVNAKASLLAGQRIKLIVILDGTDKSSMLEKTSYYLLQDMEKAIYAQKQYAMIHFVSCAEDGACFVREWEADGVISIGFTDSGERTLREMCDRPILFFRDCILGVDTVEYRRSDLLEFIESLYN